VLATAWNFRRLPLPQLFSLPARPGWLRMQARPTGFGPRSRPPFLGMRQAESDFQFTVRMQFAAAEDGVEAGIAILQEDDPKYLSVNC
jgi:xylan 1,4-beta-xylosidase